MRINRASFYLFITLFGLLSCEESYKEPHISLEEYQIEDGFNLDVVASEPLIKSPVAIDFDEYGRVWVVEMPGFMRTIDGEEEEDPSGTIKILEDLDQDGIMDHSKIFLDSLVLPRAIALVYGGLLYAEPSNLWFVDIEGDKPGKRTLVDSLYAPVGNPEHQSNGLKLNIDNWIYSAKSNSRYQLKNGKWLKEVAGFRGQWGISQDDYGRLYYNNNSTLLLADFLLPNRLIRNPYYIPTEGVNKSIAKGQRVYPLQASYVNRGYAQGVLDKDSLLIKVTAACSPLVYRGGSFDSIYKNNIFVCLPSANVIKRNVLSFNGIETDSKEVSVDKEFLASYDRGFRPVNLNNGPDGNMYVVDMHIGMLQHYAFLSPYLKKLSREKKLDTIIDMGRILKISSQSSGDSNRLLFEKQTPEQLVGLLKNKNGWIRDHAQQYIIYHNVNDAIPYLKKLVVNIREPLAQLHAMYTLSALEALNVDTLIKIARISESKVTASVLVLLENFVTQENVSSIKDLFKDLFKKNDSTIDLYLGTTLGVWARKSQKDFFPLIATLLNKYSSEPLFNEAVLSGIGGLEESFLASTYKRNFSIKFKEALITIVERKKENNPNSIYKQTSNRADARTAGAKLYRNICAACHAADGSGIPGLAPPLMNSEFIEKPYEKLGLIILHGLEGPVHVNDKLYELDNAMPGLLHNDKLSNRDIADIISYVASAFSDVPGGLKSEEIELLREKFPTSDSGYTENELLSGTGNE